MQVPVVVTPTPMLIRATPTPAPTPKSTTQPTPAPVIITAAPKAVPTYYAEKTTPVPAEEIKFIDFEDTTKIYANMIVQLRQLVMSGPIRAPGHHRTHLKYIGRMLQTSIADWIK